MAFLLCTCSDLELIVSLCLTCIIGSGLVLSGLSGINEREWHLLLDEKGHVKKLEWRTMSSNSRLFSAGMPGGTPLYKPYKYVPPPWIGFGGRFGLDFAHFGLESGMGFEGTTGVYECIYRCSSKWVSHKEKYANSKCIFRNLFSCCSNISNNDIIFKRPGLKTGVKNDILGLKRGQDFENSASHPYQDFPEVSPPGQDASPAVLQARLLQTWQKP